MLTVQKFGGTSVGNHSRLFQVADIIKNKKTERNTIIVVSAMNLKSKSKGTTNHLINALLKSIKGKNFKEDLNIVQNFHLNIIQKTILNSESEKLKSIQYVKNTIYQTEKFLDALKVIKKISGRACDQVIKIGEQLSAYILSALLKDIGLNPMFIDLSKIMQTYIPKKELSNKFMKKIFHESFIKPIQNDPSIIPVATGFIGEFKNGILKSIGRGYTDYTASLIGSTLNAEEIQIWKEVEGMFSSHPCIIEKNKIKFLEFISADEALELSSVSPEVIHPFAIQQIKKSNICIRIKNTLNPSGLGTLISKDKKINDFLSVKGIAIRKKLNIINIKASKIVSFNGLKSKILKIFEDFKISIHMITTSETSISVCIEDNLKSKILVKNLSEFGTIEVTKNASLIAVVGENIKKHNNLIHSKIFETLKENNIEVNMISQSASQISILCVIKNKDGNRALSLLHDQFFNNTSKNILNYLHLIKKPSQLAKLSNYN